MTSRVVLYPVRAGHTIVRSPLIVGESIRGERTFLSERGFFQASEEAREMEKASPASPEQGSIPMGRGQRIPR